MSQHTEYAVTKDDYDRVSGDVETVIFQRCIMRVSDVRS